MHRSRLAFVAAILFLPAFCHAAEMLSPVDAQRIGLVESWHRQLAVARGADSLVDIRLWVQKTKEVEYLEIVRTDKDGKPLPETTVLRRISLQTKDAMGNVIGAKEAARLANLDILKLKRRGIAATTRSIKVKQVRLYTLSEDGGLSAYDAETGESIWSIRVGNKHLTYGPLGITDEYVSVINGNNLYRVIANERQLEINVAPGGRTLPMIELDNTPIMGATNTAMYTVIPTVRKGLDCYTFDEEFAEPSKEIFSGHTNAQPRRYSTSQRIGWTTDKGFFYLMDCDGRPTTLFRLQLDGVSVGGATPGKDDMFFLGTSNGRAYGVKATKTGQVVWNKSLGEPFYQQPFVVNNRVLLPSSYGNLFSLDAADGLPTWSAPAQNMDSIFSKIGDLYIGRNVSGAMAILSAETGIQQPLSSTIEIHTPVLNEETDRLYLVDRTGTIQCLRPVNGEMPVFYGDATMAAASSTAETAKPAEPKTEAENPFGAQPDAGETKPAADPFGAGGDPFGSGDAGGDEPMADPFGGADPFGN